MIWKKSLYVIITFSFLSVSAGSKPSRSKSKQCEAQSEASNEAPNLRVFHYSDSVTKEQLITIEKWAKEQELNIKELQVHYVRDLGNIFYILDLNEKSICSGKIHSDRFNIIRENR